MFFKKKNRRGAKRVAINQRAILRHSLVNQTREVTIIDLSETGAGLCVSEFIMRDIPIEVDWEGGLLKGTVQYCRPLNSGDFKVGMRFLD